MKKIFVSYRRAESEDFCGRLVDRLAGYFGRDRISMDVDNLVSGESYREQIAEIIGESDIVLAVIGSQWFELENHKGERRIDDPDDQLRIELETARAQNKTIIPILIHGAELTKESPLPESLQWLATLNAIPIASGSTFNSDLRLFIERLESQHRMRVPDRRFPWQLILIPLGIVLVVGGSLSAFFYQPYFVEGYIIHYEEIASGGVINGGMEIAEPQQREFRADLLSFIFYSVIPLILGPSCIVAGKRYCCLTQETQSRLSHYASGLGRRRTPKSTWAVLCLAAGVSTMGLGLLAVLPVIVFGVLTIRETRMRKGWIRGRSLVVIGMVVMLLSLPISGTWQYQTWKGDRWLSHYQLGLTMIEEGRLPEAAQAFDAASRRFSQSEVDRSLAQLRHAEVLLEMENYAESIAKAEEILGGIVLNQDGAIANSRSTYSLAAAVIRRAEELSGVGSAESRQLEDWLPSLETQFFYYFDVEPLFDSLPFEGALEMAPPPAPEFAPPVVDPSA